MRNHSRIGTGILTGMLLTFILNSPWAWARGHDAGGPAGQGMPHGFSQGEKEGWHGENTPPGWGHGKKEGWLKAHMPPGLQKHESGGDRDGG